MRRSDQSKRFPCSSTLASSTRLGCKRSSLPSVLTVVSRGPKRTAKRICSSSVKGWSWKTRRECSLKASQMCAQVPSSRGWRRFTPLISTPNFGCSRVMPRVPVEVAIEASWPAKHSEELRSIVLRARGTVKAAYLTSSPTALTRTSPGAAHNRSKESPHVQSVPMDPSLRWRPCSGPGASASVGRRCEDDAVATQDLYSARRQDPRHQHPGVRQEDRRGGDDTDLYIRRHVDQVHRSHR